MRDNVNNIGVVQALAPAVQSATIASDEIDLHGFNAATIVISTGAIASSGNFTPTIQETVDIESPPSYSDVAAADLIGSLPSVLEANKVYKVGYKGHARYLTVTLTKNSGTSIAAAVDVIMANAQKRPVE